MYLVCFGIGLDVVYLVYDYIVVSCYDLCGNLVVLFYYYLMKEVDLVIKRYF